MTAVPSIFIYLSYQMLTKHYACNVSFVDQFDLNIEHNIRDTTDSVLVFIQ